MIKLLTKIAQQKTRTKDSFGVGLSKSKPTLFAKETICIQISIVDKVIIKAVQSVYNDDEWDSHP